MVQYFFHFFIVSTTFILKHAGTIICQVPDIELSALGVAYRDWGIMNFPLVSLFSGAAGIPERVPIQEGNQHKLQRFGGYT